MIGTAKLSLLGVITSVAIVVLSSSAFAEQIPTRLSFYKPHSYKLQSIFVRNEPKEDELDLVLRPASPFTIAPQSGAPESNGRGLWLGSLVMTLDRALERAVQLPLLGTVPIALDLDIENPRDLMLGTKLRIRERFTVSLDGGFLGRKQLGLSFGATF